MTGEDGVCLTGTFASECEFGLSVEHLFLIFAFHPSLTRIFMHQDSVGRCDGVVHAASHAPSSMLTFSSCSSLRGPLGLDGSVHSPSWLSKTRFFCWQHGLRRLSFVSADPIDSGRLSLTLMDSQRQISIYTITLFSCPLDRLDCLRWSSVGKLVAFPAQVGHTSL